MRSEIQPNYLVFRDYNLQVLHCITTQKFLFSGQNIKKQRNSWPYHKYFKRHINFIDWFSLEPVISWWKQWMNLSNVVSSNYPKLLSVTAGLSALSFLSLEWFSRQKSTVISMFLQTKGGVDREELLDGAFFKLSN